MMIQCDSREGKSQLHRIETQFDQHGVNHFVSKLYVGDYMSYDNPRLVIDRKQNLAELCGNVCQQHKRFRDELLRAQENGIKLIILCEHGGQVKSLEDVHKWQNPRRKQRIYNPTVGRWVEYETNAMTGEKLQKVLTTMQEKYGCEFLFCSKENTGRRIIEILSGGLDNDSSGNKTTIQDD